LRTRGVQGTIASVVAAAVGVGVLAIWLTTGRVQFTWRISWLAVAFVVVCVSSLAAGDKLAGWIAAGIFEVIRGVVTVIGML
jgi:hypothetical protein